MALKGMTKIELTNVKTGEVETVEKHNMVTNALKSVLSNPFGWQTRSAYNRYSIAGAMMPLCNFVIGGILLYEGQIPENPNQLYAQPGNALTGYANNEVNDTADTMRGSINMNESGPLESGDGYRFVFDFNTSQANGVIGAVGLTSKCGGRFGPDSAYVNTTSGFSSPTPSIWAYTNGDEGLSDAMLPCIVAYNEETCIAISVQLLSPGSITINRIWFPTSSWQLSGSSSPWDGYKIVETKILTTETFGKKLLASSGFYYGYYNFCDGEDGYIWGFEHQDGTKGNSSGTAKINWIKINVDSLEYEEGAWEIDAQIYALGIFYSNYFPARGSNSLVAASAILDGFLFCYQYDRKKIVKIDLQNVTNVSFIDIDINIGDTEKRMCVYGNVLHLSGGYLNADKFIKCMQQSRPAYSGSSMVESFDSASNCYGPQFYAGRPMKFGVYTIMFSRNSSYIAYGLSLIANYLATINNLPAPVEKTADKTMKITYIIREETET